MDGIAYAAGLIVALAVYWRLPGNGARILFAALASTAVVFYWDPQGAAMLLAQTGLVFWLGGKLREKPDASLWRFAGAMTVPLSALLFFKYFSPIAAKAGWLPAIAVPIGVSYYSFKHMHFLIESSRGKLGGRSFITYVAYVFFLPMFSAGPIERFDRFSEQVPELAFSWGNVSLGLERILIGAIKKFVVADYFLGAMYLNPRVPDEAFVLLTSGSPQLEWYQLLIAGVVKYAYIYMDFSGYTDMVLGVSLLFGVRLMDNFNFPFLRPNLAEFWRNWHISLSSWARDYVYFPVLARFRSTELALIATMTTIGLWHGLRSAWVLWALHHSIGLIILARYHRWVRRKPRIQAFRASRLGYVLGVTATIWYVSVGHLITLHHTRISRLDMLRVYLEALTFGVLS